MATYTLLDWDWEHADSLGVAEWYSQQFDPLEAMIETMPKTERDANWIDAMLFVAANWIKNYDSQVPLILRDHFDGPPTDSNGFGPIIGLRLADRWSRSDVLTVFRAFFTKPAQTRAGCYIKADVAVAMMAERNITKDILLFAVHDLAASMQLLRDTEP